MNQLSDTELLNKTNPISRSRTTSWGGMWSKFDKLSERFWNDLWDEIDQESEKRKKVAQKPL